jgi:hypothetical protein
MREGGMASKSSLLCASVSTIRRKKLSMGTIEKYALITATALVCLILGVASYTYIYGERQSAGREAGKTDPLVVSMDGAITNFESEVKSHAVETVTRTVIIRERVAAEVRAMPADALVDGVIYELELFRRGASEDRVAACPP